MRDKPTHLPTAKRGGYLEIMKTLFEIISEIKGMQSAEITYVFDCGFPKKSGLGNVTKRVTLNCDLNYNYLQEVRNRIAAKGGNPNDFTSESLKWGQWEIENLVIAHKGERYLRYYCKSNSNTSVMYFVDGHAATAQEVANIKAYLATKDTTSQKQAVCGLQKDEQVSPRNVKFENILLLKVNGETYIKQNNAAA